METMTTTKADAKTRELNAKAKMQAQKDMNAKTEVEQFDTEKNAIGVKQHDKKAPAKPKEKPAKAPKPVTFTSKLDEIIKGGGTWEQLIELGNAAAKELMLTNGGVNVEFNGKAKLISLIKYRMDVQGNKDYLGKLKITDKGVL